MARVIVSAGHTNDNPGTVVGDVREVDVSRRIAKYVVSGLRNNGVITLSVPYDMPLERRISWINMTGYKKDQEDILIEIHANEGGKSGLEAWYVDAKDGKSKKLAKDITDTVHGITKLKIQGINDQKTHELGNIKLLEDANPIPVLLECLYLDSDEDRKFLEDEAKVQKLGDAIVRGITNFFGLSFSASKTAPEKKEEIKKEEKQDESKKIDDLKPSFMNNNLSNNSSNSDNFGFGDNNNSNNNSFGANNLTNNNSFGGNNFGGNNNSFGGGNNSFGGNNAFGGNNKSNMTRDERKDMIKKMYKKSFGREAEQGDLNYFLNIGISEEQMMKRILDSQEHVDQVANAKKYDDVKKQYDDIKSKYDTLEKSFSDQKEVMDKLNELLLQKNQALGTLQKKIMLLTSRLEDLQLNKKFTRAKVDYKGTLIDQIFNYFSKKLS